MSTPPSQELLRSLGPLKLRTITKTDKGWTVEAEGRQSASCPHCQTPSRSRHSRYWRTLHDLPLQGASVLLRVRVSRWRCRTTTCERRVFVERLPELCAPHAQRTTRASQIVALLAHTLGGRPAQRLAGQLGVAASRDTLLRCLKRATPQTAPTAPVPIPGVDDWAWRKGQRFGTILVDLQRRQVVDLLPDRSAESLATWLRAHPEVTVVSRDRQGLYAEGTPRCSPNYAPPTGLLFVARAAIVGPGTVLYFQTLTPHIKLSVTFSPRSLPAPMYSCLCYYQ